MLSPHVCVVTVNSSISTQTWIWFPFFFLEYLAELLLIFPFAPGLRPEVDGDGNGDGLAACVRQVLSLLFVQVLLISLFW